MMPDVETAGTLAVPIWLAGAAAAVLVVAVLLAVKRAGVVALISSLFRVGLIAALVLGAWLYVQQRGNAGKDSNAQTERRVLDNRKAALMTGAIVPGSALSCLDEMAGEAVESACEKAVFASPEAVASAVKYVAAQLTLLNDGTVYAERDPGYAAELAPLRTAIELDRFGIVAHVLGDQGCIPERCDALMRFHDSSKVLANLRNHTFEEQVKKYAAIWDRPADRVAATAGPVVLPRASGPEDGQEHNFPSANSAPPVSIRAPEGPPPREGTTSESADVVPQPPVQSAVVTPVPPPRDEAASESADVMPQPPVQSEVTPLPPRRPPQVRAPRPRVEPTPQLPPLDVRGTPPPPPGPFR
jgi:hypothetical protein